MTVLVRRPDATVQLGSWTVVGAATAHAALLDASDSSYVQLTSRAWLDTQILRLGIEDVTIPAGAKIFSVRTRVRIQQVPVGQPRPRCLGWFRCRKPRNLITAIILFIFRLLFKWHCPEKPTTVDPDWVDQELEYLLADPEGAEWTVDSFNDYEVQLGRDDTNGNALRIAAVYVDIDYSEQPTVDVTGPTGTITDASKATVTWTYADPQQDRQQAFQVRVFTAGQVGAPGFDPAASIAVDESGWTYSESLEWTTNIDLVNDTYHAYVTVEKVWSGLGTFRSGTDSTSWTQNVAGAPNPLVTTATFDSALNRVALVLQPSSGSPVTVAYTLEASRDFGLTWSVTYGGGQIPANGTNPVTVYDYAAPLNVESRYRASAYRELGSLRYISGYSAVTSVTPVVDGEIWLKDPASPALNSRLPIARDGNDKPSRPRDQGVFSVLSAGPGPAYKVVVNGPPQGREGTLELIFHERQDTDLWTAFNDLYNTGRTLLLQYPHGEQFYIQLGDDLKWTWDLRRNDVRWRRATVSYVEVKEPTA